VTKQSLKENKMIAPRKEAIQKFSKVEKLIAIGGSRWTKESMDRVYFDAAAYCKLIGLENRSVYDGGTYISMYKGQKISNSKAAKMIPSGKVYFDVMTDSFVGFDASLIAIEL